MITEGERHGKDDENRAVRRGTGFVAGGCASAGRPGTVFHSRLQLAI